MLVSSTRKEIPENTWPANDHGGGSDGHHFHKVPGGVLSPNNGAVLHAISVAPEAQSLGEF